MPLQSNNLGYILDFTSTSCLLDCKCDIWWSSVMELWIISVAVSRRKEKSSCLYVWVQFELFLNMSKLSGKLKMDQDVVGIKLGLWLLNYSISKQHFMHKEFHHMNLQNLNLPLSTYFLLIFNKHIIKTSHPKNIHGYDVAVTRPES